MHQTRDRDWLAVIVGGAFWLCLGFAAAVAHAAPTPARGADAGRLLTLERIDSEPDRRAPSERQLEGLARAVAESPRDRQAHFELVRGLMKAERLDDALEAARAWRNKDAYNLVVVRLLGDIHAERGERDQARRAYSAVVELLPEDVQAHRALATVLKQAGDLEGAYERLTRALALEDRDVRLAFELADVAHRLGREAEAVERFEAIVAHRSAPSAIRYPAKQRLGQLYASQLRRARGAGDEERAEALADGITKLRLKGGTTNDIKVYLTWDTDRTDVDLWVVNPARQKVNYQRKKGRFGGALFDDVTSGYGPESFTAKRAHKGTYEIKVNFYGTSRSAFNEARGEVVVVLHDGTEREQRHVLPYRLFRPGQTVTVARIKVAAAPEA